VKCVDSAPRRMDLHQVLMALTASARLVATVLPIKLSLLVVGATAVLFARIV
jgi:hypothetical protein